MPVQSLESVIMPTEQPANAISFVAAEVELRGDRVLWILLHLVARALEVCVCVERERDRETERQTDRLEDT
jgi:hypothetical protein